jgi:hypothetical protein
VAHIANNMILLSPDERRGNFQIRNFIQLQCDPQPEKTSLNYVRIIFPKMKFNTRDIKAVPN